MVKVENAMPQSPCVCGPPAEASDLLSGAQIRLKRLRHIRPLPHPQQIAVVQITRRARHAAQRRKLDSAGTGLGDQMLALLPNLWAFALSLTNDPVRADDLVQETILRAWSHLSSFEPGTNLGAWLFKILRNHFYSDYRKRSREVDDPDGAYVERLTALPGQEAGLAIAELRRALVHLPVKVREALLLVGAEGLTYEDTALIQGVAVGTVKSRVNRARRRLADLLQVEDWHEIGPDRVMKAALQEPSTQAIGRPSEGQP